MKKIILNMDEVGSVTPQESVTEYEDNSSATMTLQLVKQGVTVDEIIKLKNADLI
tara:strand:- start:1596 stop:1760 length:165 start_codon:yes stop_codon:yes gene_type:complete